MRRQNGSITPQHENVLSTKSIKGFLVWFSGYYKKSKRVYCHIVMWLFFGALVRFGLAIDYHLDIASVSFFSIRTVIGNIMFFYTFFYLILPRLLLKKRMFLGVLCSIGILFIWKLIDYCLVWLTIEYSNVISTSLLNRLKPEVSLDLPYVFSPKRIFGGLVFILYSVSPIFCLKFIVEMIKFAHKTTQIEKGKAAMEVAFLRSQLNPHFLFNSLNTIYILNRKNDSTASDVILELSDILRYMLYESNAEEVVLEKELNFIKNYVELERARHAILTRIEFNCDLSNISSLSIAPLLTFPFIENAFKHGLGSTLKDAWMKIDIYVKNNVFYFKIKNSKEEEQDNFMLTSHVGGIGLSNTKKRLELLYPSKHLLEIENLTNEYSLSLEINLKE